MSEQEKLEYYKKMLDGIKVYPPDATYIFIELYGGHLIKDGHKKKEYIKCFSTKDRVQKFVEKIIEELEEEKRKENFNGLNPTLLSDKDYDI